MSTAASRLLLLSSFVFLLLPARANACMGAWHYRVFPVATAGDDILAVTFNLHRISGRDFGNVRWRGEGRLVTLAPDGSERNVLMRGDVLDPKGIPRDFFRKALEGVASIPSARRLPAGPEVEFCQFRADCGGLALVADGSSPPSFELRRQGKARVRRPLPVPDVAADHLETWRYDGDETPAQRIAKTRQYVTEFGRGLRLSSVRRYRAPGRTFLVATVTSGDFRFGFSAAGIPEAGGCAELATCLYPEPTPHHGDAFDVVILDPKGARESVVGAIAFDTAARRRAASRRCGRALAAAPTDRGKSVLVECAGVWEHDRLHETLLDRAATDDPREDAVALADFVRFGCLDLSSGESAVCTRAAEKDEVPLDITKAEAVELFLALLNHEDPPGLEPAQRAVLAQTLGDSLGGSDSAEK